MANMDMVTVYLLNIGWNLISLLTGEKLNEAIFNNKKDLDNLLPTETLLLDLKTSRMACASYCLMLDSCLSIFHNDTTEQCYGFKYRLQITTSTHSAQGYTYFEQLLDCGSGYTLIGRGKVCVKLLPSSHEWQIGRDLCQSDGADLVVLDTAEKEQDLKDYFLSIGGTYVWVFLGLSDRDKEGTWKWVDGRPVSSTYTNWLVGAEPNSKDGGFVGSDSDVDCAVALNNLWYDRNCYRKCQIVCEKVAK